jgi:hypothetical protein
MKKQYKESYSAEEYDFISACEELGINPYKERYWKDEIARLLGVEADTVNRWSQIDRKAPLPLYIWRRNRRVFTNRKDLIEAFQDVESVGMKIIE